MHGQVPGSPVLGKVLAVPPIVVEVTVAEVEQLALYAEHRMEDSKEPGDPEYCVGNGEFDQLVSQHRRIFQRC